MENSNENVTPIPKFLCFRVDLNLFVQNIHDQSIAYVVKYEVFTYNGFELAIPLYSFSDGTMYSEDRFWDNFVMLDTDDDDDLQ